METIDWALLLNSLLFLFIAMSFLFRSTHFWENYIVSNYRTSKEFQANMDEVHKRIIASAINSGFAILKEETNNEVVTCRTPMSFKSFGESIKIRINRTTENTLLIEFFSKCTMPTTFIDWKKNKSNAEVFFKNMELPVQ